jgi:putative endonuclease
MLPGGLTRWPLWRRWFGSRAERAAADFLKRLGYRVLARNVRLRQGELDLIALDGDTIVFAEVRSTEGPDPLRPAESVDAVKQKKLSELAVAWLQSKRLLGRNARFDVIAVSWPGASKTPTVVHYKSAFESVGRFQMFS